MPRLPLLSLTEKVLLVVIEVRRHEPRVVFAGGRLKGAQIGAIGLPTLVERNVSQRGRSLFNDIEQVLQDGHIDLASFGRSRLFDISAEHDMGDPADLSELSLQIVPVEQVRADNLHAQRQRRGAARQSVDPRAREGGPMLGGGAPLTPWAPAIKTTFFMDTSLFLPGRLLSFWLFS
jgi:hypothetical protein